MTDLKNNLEERFIELRNENSKYSIKVLELEQELAQVRKEIELLKHEYREKLGYLASNKWTSKTLVSIEMERLENERIRDRFSYEKSILVQELQKTREQLSTCEKLLMRFVPDEKTIQWKKRELDAKQYFKNKDKQGGE